MSSHRPERVAEAIREVLSQLLLRAIKDPRVTEVTVTGVQMTADLRLAKVYFTCPGAQAERDKAAKGLASAAGFLRRSITKELQLRYAPDLRFYFDHSVADSAQLVHLIRQVAPPADDE